MICIYCGKLHPTLTLTGLEDHWKNNCPMLTKCSSCGEIVETRYLSDHLLHECIKRNDYKSCDRCNQSVMINLYSRHRSSDKCRLLDPNRSIGRCLLCWEDVIPDNDIGWRTHLTKKCKANPRK